MGQHGPKLAGAGHLFMWAEALVEGLAPYPHVRIVVSTNWVRRLPFEQVCDFLPLPLRARVVGSTWQSIQTDPDFSRGLQLSYWDDASRYQQVRRWVNVHRLRQWVAIDDDAQGWADVDSTRLVHTSAETGLSDPSAIARLRCLLNS